MAYSNINVAMATNVGKFKTEMAVAGAAVLGFGKSVYGTVNKIESLGKKVGGALIGIGASFTAMAVIGVKAAAELETVVNNVATVWDEAGQKATGTFLSLGDATSQLVDLSTELPQSATVLAGALYDVASAGFQGTDAITVLEASAKAASAGLTTADVAVRGITSVLNAYGESAGQSSRISDVLFQTVNLGVVTFEELSSVMGEFVGMAATAGVPIEEASAALATMTLGGISANEAATALNRGLQELIQPGEALLPLLQSMGHESGLAALQSRGLHGILGDIADVVGNENVEAFAALFPEIRALKGVLALVADEGENYNRVFAGLTDETALFGATQDALDKQSQSLTYQMTLLKNTVVAMAIEFGQALLPIVKPVVAGLQGMADAIQGLPDWVKQLAFILGTLATVLSIVLGLYILHKIQLGLLGWAMKATGVQAIFLAKAMHALKISMGIIGGILAIASVAMMVFSKDTGEADRKSGELKDTLDQVTGAITAGTAAWVRDEAVKEGWLKAAQELGIASDDLTMALLGDEAAIERVTAASEAAVVAARAERDAITGDTKAYHEANLALQKKERAHDKLEGAVGTSTKAVKEGTEAVLEDARASKVDALAIDALSTAEQKEQASALARGEAHIKATEAIWDEINAAFSLADAYSAASEDRSAFDEGGSKSADNARRDRHRIQTEGLDDEIDAETEAAEEIADIRLGALEDQQDAEKEAFEVANRDFERALAERRRIEDDAFEVSARAQTKALDDRHKAEQDGLDLILRAQKDAYDDQARARRDAHDDAMEELRDQNDDLIEEENDRWAVRKQQIQNNIDDTFGVERQGWQKILADEEDAHEDQVDTIEEAGDQAVRAEGNAFDDRERLYKHAYDDQEKIQKDALAVRQDNEKVALADSLALTKTGVEDRRRIEDQAWSDLVDLDAGKMADRHEAAKTGMDKEIEAEREGMADRHEKRREGLDLIQQLEDDAADTRVTRSKEKHIPTMAELLTQVNAELEQRRQMNRDLVTIADQGGKDMNAAVLAQIALLGPEAVRTIAASGPAAIAELVTGINNGITEAERTGALTNRLTEMGGNVGKAAGTAIATSLIEALTTHLAADPIGWVMGLAPPPAFAPQGPPRGAPYINADGGIYRFADGGEHHVAQVAPAGSWRLWAEPETGGEAYIPLAASKRGRSSSILAQVAAHFGYGLIPMAGGGITGGSSAGHGGMTVSMPIHVEARIDAGIDMGVAGRVIAREVERGVSTALGQLERQVTVKAWRN